MEVSNTDAVSQTPDLQKRALEDCTNSLIQCRRFMRAMLGSNLRAINYRASHMGHYPKPVPLICAIQRLMSPTTDQEQAILHDDILQGLHWEVCNELQSAETRLLNKFEHSEYAFADLTPVERFKMLGEGVEIIDNMLQFFNDKRTLIDTDHLSLMESLNQDIIEFADTCIRIAFDNQDPDGFRLEPFKWFRGAQIAYVQKMFKLYPASFENKFDNLVELYEALAPFFQVENE